MCFPSNRSLLIRKFGLYAAFNITYYLLVTKRQKAAQRALLDLCERNDSPFGPNLHGFFEQIGFILTGNLSTALNLVVASIHAFLVHSNIPLIELYLNNRVTVTDVLVFTFVREAMVQETHPMENAKTL